MTALITSSLLILSLVFLLAGCSALMDDEKDTATILFLVAIWIVCMADIGLSSCVN